MTSLRSPFGRADARTARWRGVVLLSALVSALVTVGTSIILRMLLSPTTPLSGFRPGPSLLGLFLVTMAGVGAGRLSLRVPDRRHAALLVVGSGAVASALWLAVEPGYSLRDVLARLNASPDAPGGSLVLGLWGILAFSWGARQGIDQSRLRPNAARNTAGIILVVAAVSTLQASFAQAQSGISTAQWALPLTVLLSGATLAASEFERTREVTRAQGFDPPSWGRWIRLVAGVGVGLAVIMVITFLLLGPGAIRQLGRALLAAWNALATAIVWGLTAVFWLLDGLISKVVELLPDRMPDPPPPTTQPPAPSATATPIPLPDPRTFEIQPWMLWLGASIGLMLLVLLVAVATRRTDEIGSPGVDHERTSLLSGSLVAHQLRRLWDRRRTQPHHRIDLSTPPRDARDAMVHLQELARRHDLARGAAESAADFSRRLAMTWRGAEEGLDALRASYEHARYARPTAVDDAAAIEAWERVRQAVRELDELAERTAGETSARRA